MKDNEKIKFIQLNVPVEINYKIIFFDVTPVALSTQIWSSINLTVAQSISTQIF